MKTDNVHTFSAYFKAISRLMAGMVFLMIAVEGLGAAIKVAVQYLFRQIHRPAHLKT